MAQAKKKTTTKPKADVTDTNQKFDIMEIGEDKPKKGKGNPKAYLNSPFVGNNAIKASKEDMDMYWDNVLTVYKWPKIDIDDDRQVENRCAQYFEHCREKGERPTVEGLAVAIGVSPRTINDWANGHTRAQFGNSRSLIIKKAKAVIQYMLAQMAMGNKIYPNVWIFYGKNWFGMRDQQDIVLTPNNAVQPEMTKEQILERIKSDVIVDMDELQDE